MNMYLQFNRKAVDDRQIDTLIGLSKGIVADGRVDQAEAETLHTWLIQARHATENPVIINLLGRVSVMLEDGVLDADESSELLATLRGIAGPDASIGELAHPTTLPLDVPQPLVEFAGSRFVFTGTCVFGTRAQCAAATVERGGIVAGNVTKQTSFLVLGTYVTDSWIHETYGRKIEKAMEYRDAGVPVAIISEEHWANCGRLRSV